MQKKATSVFIGASILFGLLGVIVALGLFEDNEAVAETLARALGALGFIVLSSFAVSVALTYLESK